MVVLFEYFLHFPKVLDGNADNTDDAGFRGFFLLSSCKELKKIRENLRYPRYQRSYYAEIFANACAKSALMSSICSIPALIRNKLGVTPEANCSASDNC